MPYSALVCKACDALVLKPMPHGPEDEYCEGEQGYERVDLYAMDSPGDRRAWHLKEAARSLADAHVPTFEDRLAEAYVRHSAYVARICDEVLDPSGALLGRVRELARG